MFASHCQLSYANKLAATLVMRESIPKYANFRWWIFPWFTDKDCGTRNRQKNAIARSVVLGIVCYMEVSWNRGTPSHHPFYFRIFPEINHPAIKGYPHGYGNPMKSPHVKRSSADFNHKSVPTEGFKSLATYGAFLSHRGSPKCIVDHGKSMKIRCK